MEPSTVGIWPPTPREGAPIVAQLHALLANASLILAALLVAEAAWRAWRGEASTIRPFQATVLVVILITGTAGLGLLLGGSQPRESPHLLYGVVAVAILPLAADLAKGLTPRGQALSTLAARVVLLILIARLFQTG